MVATLLEDDTGFDEFIRLEDDTRLEDDEAIVLEFEAVRDVSSLEELLAFVDEVGRLE